MVNESRILCWILTNPRNLPKKTIYIKQTWGPRCDRTLYMSTIEDPDFPTIGVYDDLAKAESKRLNARKVKNAWIFIRDNYPDFDFYYKVDDDTYVIVENLRQFLDTKNPDSSEFYGHRFVIQREYKIKYASGGSGYILTNKCLFLLYGELTNSSSRETCIPDGAGEDWKIARCLNRVGCEIVDTRDDEGKERFMVFPPGYHIKGVYTEWYGRFDVDKSLKGVNCCSKYPISFHYIEGDDILGMDYLLYKVRIH
ncbi:glycoprotein-N-acetylgalactosamine 3-beta-galactosyltransferase 1-like [Gordionus sp. m RMFG-2023]|uniref:glycoprotein-N-acetylgalactosamine 3-beta-galactosyltransferase 1-like n=1 Tax=Gordionus sp. m RMFG-2023 TaxID=3053472 RepID=UPI0031FD28A5